MKNSEIIEAFYTAFKEGNFQGMVSQYHDDVVFKDPAFGTLEGIRAKKMWEMLLKRSGGDIAIKYHSVTADEISGAAQWEATYIFSQTGRRVINNISAKFEFKEGKIIRHTDQFNLWKWSRQALGLKGWMLGFTSFFQKKLQAQTNRMLDKFMNHEGQP